MCTLLSIVLGLNVILQGCKHHKRHSTEFSQIQYNLQGLICQNVQVLLVHGLKLIDATQKTVQVISEKT